MAENIYLTQTSVNNTFVTEQQKGMTSDQVIKESMPVIRNVIRRLERKYHCSANEWRMDFEHDGCLAALTAWSKYDSSKHTSFITYAYKFICFDIQRSFLAELQHGQSHESYDQYICDEEYAEDMWSQMQADEVYEADYSFTSNDLREACEILLRRVPSELDREIVRRRFGLTDGFGSSFQAISFGLGITDERTRQRFNRAMEQIHIHQAA